MAWSPLLRIDRIAIQQKGMLHSNMKKRKARDMWIIEINKRPEISLIGSVSARRNAEREKEEASLNGYMHGTAVLKEEGCRMSGGGGKGDRWLDQRNPFGHAYA